MLDEPHLAANPQFADAPEHTPDHNTRFAAATRPSPPGWRRTEGGGWVRLRPEQTPLPTHGWKIHVSAVPGQAAGAIDTVWAHCTTHRTAFKFLRSRTLAALADAKRAPRSASGKLITIYPADNDQLEQALTELSRRLAGVPGPYILSDLRWRDGPLYLRYGAFRPHYCFGPDGSYVPALPGPDGAPVPDLRGTVFRVPPWAEVPDFLAGPLKAAGARSGTLPYRVLGALRFSNAGGVYRAVDPATGRTVVLREARPYAGTDREGRDAVARLRHEFAMLRRLAGLDCVPEAHALTRHWEHLFLAEEFIDGEPLQDAMERHNPLLLPGATAGALAAHTDWACAVFDRVEAALAQLHGRGICFGDLQPGNVLLRPDGSVCLVDFETARPLDEPSQPALGTAGFTAPWIPPGIEADRYALACLGLALFVPLTPLLRLAPAKHRQLLDFAAERFPLPPAFTARLRTALQPPEEPAQPAWPVESHRERTLDALRDALLLSATPERADRLFPGDPRQFDRQSAAVAYGAAGVLYALWATGRHRYPAWSGHLDWLIRAAGRTAWPRPGLYDGLAGTAWVLDVLGRPEAARAALDRLAAFDLRGCGPGLFGGLAGIGLCWLHFGEQERALAVAQRLAAFGGPAGTGLMYGWSGPALLFTQLYAHTGDRGQLDRAGLALDRDLEQLHAGRRPAALDRGSAGVALALHSYLRQRADARLSRVLNELRCELTPELVLSSGLLDGRAGLLHALGGLGAPAAELAPHRRRLALHAVPFRGRPAFPLPGLQRLSMDLATGTAGVLLAVHGAAPLPGMPLRGVQRPPVHHPLPTP
ncbi:class III lanthionine synthetase LanKC [Streptomyces orinoci]|uniref:non-specific serine/threonine protein kinase n=1 Tax=Streptomyces orinoci TaxID=67339 RepID=A0ABV3JXV2_STRON|nr:class III lanthionine synthetase LanKC [Streptomyces orinoci]